MSGKVRENNPNIRPAGTTQFNHDSTAGKCIKPDVNRQQTPDHIRKYRKSYKQQHGVTILHYGLVEDKLPKTENFGIPTKSSVKTKDCMADKNQAGITQMVNDLKETTYASYQKEPLAKTMNYGYKVPEKTQQPEFAFGVPTKQNDYTAKDVIFATTQNIKEPYEIQQQYLRTHGNYEAGEQKNREYNWKVDPTDYRFGKTEKIIPDEMKQILNQESLKNQAIQTKIVTKKQEDNRDYKNDQLGQTKNLAQYNSHIGKETVFGTRKKDDGEWDAGQCIKGETTLKESLPDKDLGHTNRFGFKNEVKQGDQDRYFGTPTIRDDIIKKGQKSVADPNNYGDEKPAVELLFPQKYDFLGVNKQDFLEQRPKDEIRAIFTSIGHKYDDDQFNAYYERAILIEESQSGDISVSGFMHAIHSFLTEQ